MKTPKPFFKKILNAVGFVKKYWILISILSLALIAFSSINHQRNSIEKQIESNREYHAIQKSKIVEQQKKDLNLN